MFRKTQKGLGALFALGLTTLTLSTPAHALPLLAETAGLTVSDILTVYPDSNDPNLVYFIPTTSEMARDSAGLPQFGFTYWGLGEGKPIADAGAYLTFSLRLATTESQRRALQSMIDQGKRVAVIPVQSSTIELNTTKDGAPLGRLFEEFNLARKGGLYGDEIGVNAILNGVGARAFKAMIDTPQLITAQYCSTVTGLGPNFHGKVFVDMERVYKHVKASATFGGWFFRKNINAEYESLKKEGHIRIEMNGGDATEEEYLRKVSEDLTAKFFTPELKMEPGQASQSGWGFARFSLNATYKNEKGVMEFEYIRRELVEREFCQNIAVKDLKPYKDQLVRNADAE